MSRGVRISQMHVDAFRGISDPIDFDLTSPITLVFAPNGTGKTTLCEAAEWLLTGQVERLRDSKDFDAAVLKSKFVTDDRPPHVVGAIGVGNEARHLSRLAVGSQQIIELGPDAESMESIGPNDLLAFLAPSAASQEAHHLRAINLRQRWLRGTRFLSAEALAALVDSDDDTIERRTQVFADLLGIRHLLDAEKLCDKYISDLTARERQLAQRIVGRTNEIESLSAWLEAADATASAMSAKTELEAAERRLQLPSATVGEDDQSVVTRLQAATAQHARRRHLLDTRSSNIEAVAAAWGTRVESEQKIASLTVAEANLANQLTSLEGQGRSAATAVTETTMRRTRQSEQARLLMSARDSLTQRILALAEVLGLAPGAPLPTVTTSVGSLQGALPEGHWSSEEQTRRREDLRRALDEVDVDLGERRRVDLLRAQLELSLADLPSEDDVASFRADAARLEAAAIEARARLEAASAPLARLQTAAADLVAHAHDGDPGECPVCSHDWGDAARLRVAMATTLETVPELARLAQVAAASAAEAARIASTRLEEATLKHSQADRLRSEIRSLEDRISNRGQRLNALGIAEDGSVVALRDAFWRLDVATALTSLLEERNRFASLLAVEPAALVSEDTPISSLPEHFQQTVADQDQAVQYQLAITAKQHQDAVAERDRLRGVYAHAQQQLQDCRAELERLRPEVARLRTLWDAAAPGRNWSQGALTELRRELSQEATSLNLTAAHLAAANAAWSTEVRRARLDELTAAIAPESERSARMVARIDAAKRAKATFHETYNYVSKRQIEDLSRVVNPLFARMHANRVFDKIKLGQTDEPLRWLADAGSQEMDPGKDFSQGQRQDLALALFLGRARSLGGTFFLDEPVTHLDDLNRVGLLDIFRACVMESSTTLNLVITTASKALARHLIEKFSSVGLVDTPAGKAAPLRVLELDGNGRTGVVKRNAFPA